MTYRIRTANKALIVDGDRMLVTVNEHDGPTFYLNPGGGQEFGEDRIEGLRRECREEIGCEVEVHGVACLRSYIGPNHRFAERDANFHQEEVFWWCTLPEGATPGVGHLGDEYQTGVAWMTLEELRASGEYAPSPLLDWLRLPEAERPLYLGDVL